MKKKLEDRDLIAVAVEFLLKMNKNKERIRKVFGNDKIILDYLKKVPTIFLSEDEETIKKNHVLILYTTIALGKLLKTNTHVTYKKYLKGEPLDEPSNEQI